MKHQQDKGLIRVAARRRLFANPQNAAGILLALSPALTFLGLMIAEALYEGYSLSSNFISDLGARCVWDFPKLFPDIATECFVPPTSAAALFFNSMTFAAGLLIIGGMFSLYVAIQNGKTSGLHLRPAYKGKLLIVFLALAGFGVMGIGLFPESAGIVHIIIAVGPLFTFGNLTAIVSASVVRRPLNVFFAALGVTGLVANVLFNSGIYLGIGPGGMERMVLYPFLLWGLAFGGYLVTHQAEP